MRDGTGPLGTGPIGRGLGPCSRGGAGQGGFRRWPGGFGYHHWFHATGFTWRQRMDNLPWREPDVDDARMSATKFLKTSYEIINLLHSIRAQWAAITRKRQEPPL